MSHETNARHCRLVTFAAVDPGAAQGPTAFDFSDFAFGNSNIVAGRCLLHSDSLRGLPAFDGTCFMNREAGRSIYSIGDHQCTVEITPNGSQATKRAYAYRGRCPINVGEDAVMEDDISLTRMRREVIAGFRETRALLLEARLMPSVKTVP